MGIPFEGIKEITPLDSSTTINTTNKTTVCVSITTYTNYYLCDQGVVQSPETCDYQYTTEITETSCETLSDGPSYSTIFFPNTGGGGGGGANSNNNDPNYDGSDPNIHGNGGTPINTAPIFDEESIQNDLDNLNEITNDLSKPFKAKVEILQQTLDQSNETGFEFRTDLDNLSNILPGISLLQGQRVLNLVFH